MSWPIQQRITAPPNPAETFIIYRAQSFLTKDGQIGPLLAYEEARNILIDAGELLHDTPNRTSSATG